MFSSTNPEFDFLTDYSDLPPLDNLPQQPEVADADIGLEPFTIDKDSRIAHLEEQLRQTQTENSILRQEFAVLDDECHALLDTISSPQLKRSKINIHDKKILDILHEFNSLRAETDILKKQLTQLTSTETFLLPRIIRLRDALPATFWEKYSRSLQALQTSFVAVENVPEIVSPLKEMVEVMIDVGINCTKPEVMEQTKEIAKNLNLIWLQLSAVVAKVKRRTNDFEKVTAAVADIKAVIDYLGKVSDEISPPVMARVATPDAIEALDIAAIKTETVTTSTTTFFANRRKRSATIALDSTPAMVYQSQSP